MMELAYDIAPKADYKFNTAFETADVSPTLHGILFVEQLTPADQALPQRFDSLL